MELQISWRTVYGVACAKLAGSFHETERFTSENHA